MEIDADTIEAGRARYAALKAAGQEEGAFEAKRDAAPRLAEPLDADRIVTTETIPGGWYWHGVVRAGEVLRVANTEGSPGVSLLLWRLQEPSERLNPPDTVKNQWTAAIGRGRVLLSDMGRAMASVLDGPEGMMDCIAGGATPASNARKYGDPHRPSASVHMLRIAAKYGLGKRDVGPLVNLFAPLTVGEGGALAFDATRELSGRFEIRAEMDVIAGLANVPHPLAPAALAAGPLTVTVWRADPAADDDLCRTATAEARRAFHNNAADRLGEPQ